MVFEATKNDLAQSSQILRTLSLMDLPNQMQAEEIANQFSQISELYDPLKTEILL
jgi:hypothetical protein